MKLSEENSSVLICRLGRRVDPKTKVTLTGEALGRIMDAARKHEQGKRKPTETERLMDIFFNGRKA